MIDRSIVMAVSLIAAAFFYFINSQSGAIIALVLGVMCELAFWFNLLGADEDATTALANLPKKDR
ncbi:MAG: hypothetical protein HRU22_16735 [Gammaproteobacteria bacterium]|nr:hypothetical protein [Gammaproteobacteria bacterium]